MNTRPRSPVWPSMKRMHPNTLLQPSTHSTSGSSCSSNSSDEYVRYYNPDVSSPRTDVDFEEGLVERRKRSAWKLSALTDEAERQSKRHKSDPRVPTRPWEDYQPHPRGAYSDPRFMPDSDRRFLAEHEREQDYRNRALHRPTSFSTHTHFNDRPHQLPRVQHHRTTEHEDMATVDLRGNGDREQQPQPGQTLHAEVSIGLEQSIKRGIVDVTVEGFLTCSRCKGHGVSATGASCGACKSTGRVNGTKQIQVDLPAGVSDQHEVTIRGAGEAGERGAAPGDLVVLCRVKKHPYFSRKGLDCFCDVPLSYCQAASGVSISIPTLYGKTTIKVKPLKSSHQEFRYSGLGFPDMRNPSAKGDLVIRGVIQVPQNLTAAQLKQLEEIESTSTETTVDNNNVPDQVNEVPDQATAQSDVKAGSVSIDRSTVTELIDQGGKDIDKEQTATTREKLAMVENGNDPNPSAIAVSVDDD